MFTSLIVDGTLKVVQLIRYRNNQNVARIYEPKGTVPQAILNETAKGEYINPVTLERFRLTPTGMVPVR